MKTTKHANDANEDGGLKPELRTGETPVGIGWDMARTTNQMLQALNGNGRAQGPAPTNGEANHEL